jgi:hypothetical protein
MRYNNTIGTRGERLNLLIRQGATFGTFHATMANPDGSPVNLTGCLIRGQIRKTADSATVITNITVTSAYDATGAYSFGITDEQTAVITAGFDIDRPESIYVWDLELLDSLGQIIPLYYGDALVYRRVTRA